MFFASVSNISITTWRFVLKILSRKQISNGSRRRGTSHNHASCNHPSSRNKHAPLWCVLYGSVFVPHSKKTIIYVKYNPVCLGNANQDLKLLSCDHQYNGVGPQIEWVVSMYVGNGISRVDPNETEIMEARTMSSQHNITVRWVLEALTEKAPSQLLTPSLQFRCHRCH